MAAAASDVFPPLKRSSSYDFLPPTMSELRVVLLGNSWSERRKVGNFILGETKFNTEEEPDNCLREGGQLDEKEIVLINTPDLLNPNISEHKLTEHVKTCVRLSDPGPHVFLLVLQPEDFTEEHKLRLCRVLELFSDRSFDHSLVLMSTPREETPGLKKKYKEQPPLKDLIRKCRYRYLKQKNLERPELLTRLGQIVKENNGEEDRIRGDQEEKEKEEQRAEIDKERKLTEKELKENGENIQKEREERKKEQEMREEEDRKRKEQEEIQRQEWERKVEALEQKIRSESESKETIDRKLKESREETRKERENWEKTQREWWEKRYQEDNQRQQEEEISLRKLQEEYEQERENDEKKRNEEDRIRREQEERERKDIEEKHKKENGESEEKI